MYATTVGVLIHAGAAGSGATILDKITQLNFFLAQIERRSLRIAELAVRQREDALDLVQESMLKLAEKYVNKPAEQWAPLFYRILQSKIRDWYRRQAARGRIFGALKEYFGDDAGDPLHLVEDTSPGPVRRLEIEQATPALAEALRRLPLRQQQVFLLRAWEGLDVQQTAIAMKCGTGSVKTHYHRALQTLRELLQDHREVCGHE
ncbi:MAG TPA: RNA polymerase sigma factor [Gammaproteobacteria bacterium]|nr:RNA polymerase sigma factor [Gammaproteobacteria bacterium]